MASILRQIVSGPRARHPEAGLDLCYVTDNIVVTSGPSSVWPKKAYRNPVEQLVGFLDAKHGSDWAVFEFRAEGTGYPDDRVYGRIHHFPWPDHHPPPFRVIPNIMAAMRNWIQREEIDADAAGEDEDEKKKKEEEEENNNKKKQKRVAVVHCKAGKGRSGTVSCSYLISEEGWKREDALNRFTIRRMRSGFGQGVSIPSQLRYVGYVDRWTNQMGKKYIDRPVQITEVHVWGLRDGVKVAVEGYVEEGKRIHNFHTFTRAEKTVVDQGHVATKQAPVDAKEIRKDQEMITSPVDGSSPSSSGLNLPNKTFVGSVQTVVLRPTENLIVPTSDINVDFERRNKASYAGFTMVTSVAHVWWNAWFEGGFDGHESGVFEIEWDAMDGIKGSARKGVRAFDRLKVVWKYPEGTEGTGEVVKEPERGEPVPEAQPADWKGEDKDKQEEREASAAGGLDSGRPGGALLTMGAVLSEGTSQLGKELGLRKSDPGSEDVSVASSVKDLDTHHGQPAKADKRVVSDSDIESDSEGVKPHGPDGEEFVSCDEKSHLEGKHDTTAGRYLEHGIAKTANIIAKMKGDGKDETAHNEHSHAKGHDSSKAQHDAQQIGAEDKDFATVK